MVGRLDADLAADVAVVDGLEGGELGGVVVVELEGLADVERISVAEGDGVGRAEALADDAIAIDEGTVGRVGVFDEESAVDLADEAGVMATDAGRIGRDDVVVVGGFTDADRGLAHGFSAAGEGVGVAVPARASCSRRSFIIFSGSREMTSSRGLPPGTSMSIFCLGRLMCRM